ncbi:WD40 repeat-like protein [Suillus brevipes Sb2]|nr:WD40 repeat-like protein [Suillus brevipes Sb2]
MTSSVVGRQTSTINLKPRQKYEGHTHWVTGAIHLPDGQRMMTCSLDSSLRVWNLNSGKQMGEDWWDGGGSVWSIALSPDGKKVVSGSMCGGVGLWDIDTGKLIATWTGHTSKVNSVCWSRDGQRVLSGSFDGTAREWDVKNGDTILGPIKTGHKNVTAVVYSPDTTMFATAGYDESIHPIKIWDAKTGELVATLNIETYTVWCLAWSPDGKTLVSGSGENSIRTWNTKTWEQLALLKGHTSAVYRIAISPNGRILASASFDNTARLWNLENSQPISSPLHHANPVTCVSFSADGTLLSTGCDDKNAYIWDVSAILKEAGLDDLLLDQPDKSPLATTQRPVQPFDPNPIEVSPRRVPQDFVDDIPNRAHSSARSHSLSSPPRGGNLRSRLLSLYRPTHSDAHDTPSRPRPFHWVRNRLSARPRGADIELHERSPAVVHVPHCQAQRRNASARETRRPTMRWPTASSSRPPNTTITQQSSDAAQAQSSSQPHATVSTVPPAATNTTSSARPHATIKYTTRWTRFWLYICCASPEYTDGHH